MAGETDPVTVALTGVLPAGIIVGALLAYPVARLLLAMYSRSVARAMATYGKRPSASSKVGTAAVVARPAHELKIVNEEATAASRGVPAAGAADLTRAPWPAAGVYAAAGCAFAVVMTAGWLLATRDASLPATKLLLLFWTYCWPAVLTVNLVAGLRGHHRITIGGYLAVFALLVVVALLRNPQMR